MKAIKNVLISVYHKEGISRLLDILSRKGAILYSTGGTYDYIKDQGYDVNTVESLTGYPSVLGGRVKTLHPAVFGGILARGRNPEDERTLAEMNVPRFDLVVVDLYPFEHTVAQGSSHEATIEKVDIGGISLIRAAAKNYADVVVIPSFQYIDPFLELFTAQDGQTTESQRRYFASAAFGVSSHYDTAIFNYFNRDNGVDGLRISSDSGRVLRYGENPHQEGRFFGDFDGVFEQLHGKAISYNNMVDIDAGVHLAEEFEETVFAILKHTNACGLATGSTVLEAWEAALAGDPVSAFGGVLVTNAVVDREVARAIDKLFFEVLVAPGFEEEALAILKKKKNRILLKQKIQPSRFSKKQVKSVLNGYLIQDKDREAIYGPRLSVQTQRSPEEKELKDMIFAMKAVKHAKSNAIVLAKDGRLLGSGTGQTSRIDALKQAVDKGNGFDLDLNGAVMASDAFFPFADSVEEAHNAGITAVIQPGGSRRDQESIDFCDQNQMTMVFTGKRHFKH